MKRINSQEDIEKKTQEKLRNSELSIDQQIEIYAESEYVHESWLFEEAIAAKKAKNQDSIGLLGELFESGTALFQENIIASINNQANRKCKNYWFLSYCDFYYDDKLFMSCNGKFGEVV